MWTVLPLLCAGVLLLGAPASRAAAPLASASETFHFRSWMAQPAGVLRGPGAPSAPLFQHQKAYSARELPRRLSTFLRRWREVQAHNAANSTFRKALNQFSDMSFAEFKRKYLWWEPQNCSATKGNYFGGVGPYPTSVDWRKKGNFVSAVKNQGACGSCWTFSTTGALESAVAIAGGKLLSLAEQQLVDCAQAFNNHGCQGYGRWAPDSLSALLPLRVPWGHPPAKGLGQHGAESSGQQGGEGSWGQGLAVRRAGLRGGAAPAGRLLAASAPAPRRGLPSQAFEYIRYNQGIMGEDAYPYRAREGRCKFQPGKAIAFVKDVANITMDDEQAMVEAVALHGPVSFAFEVTEDFMMYRRGVYSSTSCHKTPDKVNHAVLAVGYGEENGVPYWIVKNSWGPQWGMNGYFLIERGKNMCGLAACASFPVPRV
ncbi:Pro-cathepsin H [Galemys pyrenaicus]|uniref:Pro-cathepsin H n=1 Tax=Galemys pyrenaicus TaxID=202257 RepID=A0A8J6A6S8_GALPY|nr:Pro-cathepsin H [Galemys pyrenaicus]